MATIDPKKAHTGLLGVVVGRSRVVVHASLRVVRHPAWEGPGQAKMGANGPQGLPKAFQNGVRISSKRGSDLECSKMSISDQFFNNFLSKNQTKFVQILEGICAWIDVCETSQIINNRDTYCTFEGLAMLDYFGN